MKGIVFVEFMEMVESQYGLDTVDEIIEASNLPSEACYTAVGTYDFNEMVQLISNLHQKIGTPVDDLLHCFGRYLFTGLSNAHPEVIQNYASPIGLLFSIEDHIHVHVKKLYPDAELPTFKILDRTETSISMVYTSNRGLYRLAHGLIEKCFEHYHAGSKVSYELLREDGTEVKFDIVQVDEG